MTTTRLYFSFRSPFSWFAFHRLTQSGAIPWSEIEAVPVFPPNEQAVAAISGSKVKGGYAREDAARFAAAYGLELNWPEKLDTDWPRPHCVFLWAESIGRGPELAMAAFAARFSRGLELGLDSVIREVAESAGVDPDAALAAAEAPEWRERLAAGFAKMREDRVWGVPTFVFEGQRFWGNDRLEWLLRERERSGGAAVPDLAGDPLLAPHSLP